MKWTTRYLSFLTVLHLSFSNAFAFYEGKFVFPEITNIPVYNSETDFIKNSINIDITNMRKYGGYSNSCYTRKRIHKTYFILQIQNEKSFRLKTTTYFVNRDQDGKFSYLGSAQLNNNFYGQEIKPCRVNYCALAMFNIFAKTCIITGQGKLNIRLEE